MLGRRNSREDETAAGAGVVPTGHPLILLHFLQATDSKQPLTK